jgi:hypothetical protein
MAFVRRRIERNGEQLWQLEDFRDLSFIRHDGHEEQAQG